MDYNNYECAAIVIRKEEAADAEAIRAVTKAAFEGCPHSDHFEQFIINALREAGALALSLVAEAGGRIAGHVAFSPDAVSDGSVGWHGLGPISVSRTLQRRGVGSALIRESLSLLAALGAHGCVLPGSPKYHGRFSFVRDPELALPGVPQGYFLALPFGENHARGIVSYHPSFAARE